MPSTRALFSQEKGHDSLFPLEGTVHGLYTEGVSISANSPHSMIDNLDVMQASEHTLHEYEALVQVSSAENMRDKPQGCEELATGQHILNAEVGRKQTENLVE